MLPRLNKKTKKRTRHESEGSTRPSKRRRVTPAHEHEEEEEVEEEEEENDDDDDDDDVYSAAERTVEGEEEEEEEGGDVSDDGSDDFGLEGFNHIDPNDLVYVEDRSLQEFNHMIYGDADSIEQFESRLDGFDRNQWATLASTLMQSNVDQNCSERDLHVVLRFFHQLFAFRYKDDYSVVDRNQAIYPNVTNMKEQYKKLQRLFGSLQFEFTRRSLINDDTESGRELQGMMTKIAFGMKISFDQMVLNRMMQKNEDQSLRSLLQEMTPLAFFQELNTNKLKPVQQLIHFYYREAFKNNYRKDGDCIYKPRYNNRGDFVYSYEYVCDISDFVFHSIFPIEQNHYWFNCLTEKANNAQHCIKMLTHLKSEWIPELERNPDVHAFQNGIFVLSQNQFYWNKRVQDPTGRKRFVGNLSGNLIAVKFHDIYFHEDEMEEEMRLVPGADPHYMTIRMDAVNTIFATQNFTPKEREWVLALLGRLFFDLGKHDNWAVFPYFLGLAGTGKSTLLRLVASMFEPRDVGYMNNTLQKTFALEGIHDKRLYLALDIDDAFQLDPATFNSMVAVEEIAVTRKHKMPLTKVWNIPGAAAGNRLPAWPDHGGSLSRRLVVIEFLKLVYHCDPNLFEKCLMERDRFLKVIISAYLSMCHHHGDRGIKEVLPEKFRDSEKRALLELNILVAFIQNCCVLDEEEQKTMIQPFKEFNRGYKHYCITNSIKPKPLNYNSYNGVFAKYQVEVIEPKPDDPFGQTARYIKGLKLKDSIIEELANQAAR